MARDSTIDDQLDEIKELVDEYYIEKQKVREAIDKYTLLTGVHIDKFALLKELGLEEEK